MYYLYRRNMVHILNKNMNAYVIGFNSLSTLENKVTILWGFHIIMPSMCTIRAKMILDPCS